MRKIKIYVSFLLSAAVIFLSAAGVQGTGGEELIIDSSFSVSASEPEKCREATELIQRAMYEGCGITLGNEESGSRCIELILAGESADYSVSVDREKQKITLSGGSAEALTRAAEVFLTFACAAGKNGRLAVDDSVEYSFNAADDSVDNSSLLSYKGDENKLVYSFTNGLLKSPEWLDSLILTEVRLDTASIGGTFEKSRGLIDFYARAGVNGIWLTPVYDRGSEGNGYSNFGPHTIDPVFSGTRDYDTAWQMLGDFTDYAHSKGIYVFLDVITWGVVKNAPLLAEHPDWFSGEAWGNAAFNWESKELRVWYVETLVNNILVTGADGYRCDCEPNYTGYDIFGKVRSRLAEKGKYIAIISEDTSTRNSVYDFEQDGVLDYAAMDRAALYSNPVNFFADGILDIVDSVKTGEGIGSYNREGKKLKRGTSRYYTNCITNHDYQRRNVCGSRIKIGYSAILAPFIPLWYMGDEFNANCAPGVQYDIPVDYSDCEKIPNKFFFEDVKRMIAVRRSLPRIFETPANSHRNSNICEVSVDGMNALQSYARYADNKAVLVIANSSPQVLTGKVHIPFSKCEINGFDSYTVTDLMTGRRLVSGTKAEIDGFTAFVPCTYNGVYLVEGNGERALCPGAANAFLHFSEWLASAFIKLALIFEK